MHYHLEGHKELTAHKDVLILEEPDDVYVPLVNGRATCTPVVQPGDKVCVGTKLGERYSSLGKRAFPKASAGRLLPSCIQRIFVCQRRPGDPAYVE